MMIPSSLSGESLWKSFLVGVNRQCFIIDLEQVSLPAPPSPVISRSHTQSSAGLILTYQWIHWGDLQTTEMQAQSRAVSSSQSRNKQVRHQAQSVLLRIEGELGVWTMLPAPPHGGVFCKTLQSLVIKDAKVVLKDKSLGGSTTLISLLQN